MSEAGHDRGRARKRRVSGYVGTRLVNPLVRPLVERGLLPRSYALLETTGRRSGQPRRVPVGNGLRGEAFWIVAEHGWASHYVRNMQANPRVRVKVGGRWRTGTANILADDDPYERMRWLRRPFNDAIVRLAGTQPLTIRVDLDPDGS